MRQTWYKLEDGTAVDPNSCTIADNGRLQHSGGAFVAMRSHDCPQSIGVDLPDDYVWDAKADAEAKAKADAEAKAKADAEAKANADAGAKAKANYKNRESKAS